MHFSTELDLPIPRRRMPKPTEPATPLARALQVEEAELAAMGRAETVGRYSVFPAAAERMAR